MGGGGGGWGSSRVWGGWGWEVFSGQGGLRGRRRWARAIAEEAGGGIGCAPVAWRWPRRARGARAPAAHRRPGLLWTPYPPNPPPPPPPRALMRLSGCQLAKPSNTNTRGRLLR